MEFVRPQPPLEGGHATIFHFAWSQGLTVDSLRSRIADGSLPHLPKHVTRMDGKRLYAETDFHLWVASVVAWKEALPALRAAERAERAARQKWILDQQREQALAQYAKPQVGG